MARLVRSTCNRAVPPRVRRTNRGTTGVLQARHGDRPPHFAMAHGGSRTLVHLTNPSSSFRAHEMALSMDSPVKSLESRVGCVPRLYICTAISLGAGYA